MAGAMMRGRLLYILLPLAQNARDFDAEDRNRIKTTKRQQLLSTQIC